MTEQSYYENRRSGIPKSLQRKLSQFSGVITSEEQRAFLFKNSPANLLSCVA